MSATDKIDFETAKSVCKAEAKHLISAMVTGFMDKFKTVPIQVEVKHSADENIVMIYGYVDDNHVSKAIGKEGKTARAIAVILKNLAAMYGVKVAFEVLSLKQKGSSHGQDSVSKSGNSGSPS